ncbi:MAG TPA: DNA mismatch repair endonuclease MutL [Planctomycetota bacterium]
MARIRVLAPDVVNKIAAGEVIERPASVVKELVENALDAGAKEVRVDLEEGGRKLIRVTDDGGGIEAADLPLAFAPHATSKLASADDLFAVATFGFRGEALASIGSVARVRCASRTKAGEGAELVVENGEASEVRPAAAAKGTVLEVRNLFQNVPVRRKFLRSIEAETEHVVEAVARVAVARPDVRFDLFVDGERRQALPPSDRKTRIGVFFGAEVADSLQEVEGGFFKAWIAPPQHARVNAKGLQFYLNGRFIRDRVLSRAVNEAYRELIPHGRYPVAFVFLEMDPGDVDVNVHPTKIEVRFKQVWRLHDQIAADLRKSLLGSGLDVKLDPARLADRGPLLRPLDAARDVVNFFSGQGSDPGPAVAYAPALVSTGKRVFQVHDRYLVEETEEGLRIIDQHALHERVMLEEFRKQYASAAIAKQRLLIPSVVEVGKERLARLDAHRELLESFGVEVDDYGRGAVAVRAVPALVADQDPAVLLGDFLDLAEEGDPEVPLLERALEFMACRAAVKFGRRLAPEEIERLLRDADGLDFASACAHGRPTAIKLTLTDLERFFQR